MLKAVIVKSQDLLVAPSCDCIEFKVDFVDESLLQNAAQDARTDYLLVRDSIPSLRYSIWTRLLFSKKS